MSCGHCEEVLSRTVEGNEEIVTVRKTCTGNPAENFETIEVRRSRIELEDEAPVVVATTKVKPTKRNLLRRKK